MDERSERCRNVRTQICQQQYSTQWRVSVCRGTPTADRGARCYASGRASVTDLAERFSITTETVRRDLAALEAAGSVRRVHGGAVSPDRFSTTEESILERTVQRQPEKIRIAEAALALIPTGRSGSILLDAGSTTEALADLLARPQAASRRRRTPADPTPNSWSSPTPCPSLPSSSGTPGIALHLLGGKVRGLTQAAVGQSTVEAARRIRPDIAFIGTNGIHAASGSARPILKKPPSRLPSSTRRAALWCWPIPPSWTRKRSSSSPR